jgi:hypothetical protein
VRAGRKQAYRQAMVAMRAHGGGVYAVDVLLPRGWVYRYFWGLTYSHALGRARTWEASRLAPEVAKAWREAKRTVNPPP